MTAIPLFVGRLHEALLKIEGTALLAHIMDETFGGAANFEALSRAAAAEMEQYEVWRAAAEMQEFVAGRKN